MTSKICKILIHSKEGMALILVLVFTAALFVLGSALLTNAVNEKLIANYNSDDIRLHYIAEAGAEAGIAVLQQDFLYDGILSGPLGEGTYQVTFKDVSTGCRDIIASATLGTYSKTIRVTMTLPEGSEGHEEAILYWHKPWQ